MMRSGIRKKQSADPTAAIRQQRRRDALKEMNAKAIRVVLTADHLAKLERLMAAGYGSTQSDVLVKALEAVPEN